MKTQSHSATAHPKVRAAAVAVPTLLVTGAVLISGVAVSAPAFAADTQAKVTESRTTLTSKEAKSVSGAKQSAVSGMPLQSRPGFTTRAVAYTAPKAGHPYYLVVTLAETGRSAKAVQKEATSATPGVRVTSKQLNARTKSGHVIQKGTVSIQIDNGDGTTRTQKIKMVGSTRFENKTAVGAGVFYNPSAGGTAKGAQQRADKATQILAKRYHIHA